MILSTATQTNSTSQLSSKWRDILILLAVLAAGTVLTLLASSSLQQAEALRINERQTAATQAVSSIFQLELTRTTEAVRNAGLMIESNPQLTREQFNRHMQKVVENQLSIDLMEWQPIVPANELAKFEAAVRMTGLPDFRVVQPDATGKGWEPVHGRNEYVPVLFFWPEQYRTGGLDMSFSPQRMASKLQSRAVRQPVASGVFEFIKEGKVSSGAMAMAISTAVFGTDQTAKGYLAAVVDLSTLFQSARSLADAAKFDLLVFGSDNLTDAPIYTWYGNDSDLKHIGTGLRLATAADQRAKVDFAQQTWTVVLHPRPSFYAKWQENVSRLTFAAGIGMTLLILLALYRLQSSQRKIVSAESMASGARLAQELLNQRLQEAQRIAHVGNWELDVANNRLVCSEELYRLHGLIPGSPAPDYTKSSHLFTAESWAHLNSALHRATEFGTPYELELEMVRPDGSHGWMLARGEAVRDVRGSVIALRGTATDISERKKAEDALKESEEKYRNIYSQASLGIFHSTLDGRFIDVNPALARMLGYDSPEEVVRSITSISEQVYADPPKLSAVEAKALEAGGFITTENHYLRRDGTPWYGMLNMRIVKDQEGRPAYNEGFVEDITGRKLAEIDKHKFEQQMQHTQKLESLGVLSGGIAHDFNNILAIIIGYCGLTRMDYETTETNIQEIEKAAERAAGLCRQMLAYAGKAQLTKAQINMSILVGEMITMLNATLPKNVVLKPDLSACIPILTADDSQIRQVVMNLIINASEAIGAEQGEIRISLAMTSIKAGQADKDYNGKDIPPGTYICLEVTDNGCGMDEETKWRIFEPFYTTKFTGRGLGMSAVLGIIHSHGGSLQLFSELGHGTTFKVYLPVQNSNVTGEVSEWQSAQTTPWQGSGTILLVEDEDQIRSIAKTVLVKFGFTVLEAVNGKEALEMYKNNTRDIILVLTDIGMPVMDGYALFYELKMLDPKLPIIISSGFGEGDVTSRIAREDIASVINKPYNPEQLREVLKGVVEG